MMPVSPASSRCRRRSAPGTGPGCFWCRRTAASSRSRPASSRPVAPQSAIAAKVSVSTASSGCAPKTGGRVTELAPHDRATPAAAGPAARGGLACGASWSATSTTVRAPTAAATLSSTPCHAAVHRQRVAEHGQPDGDRQRHRRRLAGADPGTAATASQRGLARPAARRAARRAASRSSRSTTERPRWPRAARGKTTAERGRRAGRRRCWSSSRRPRTVTVGDDQGRLPGHPAPRAGRASPPVRDAVGRARPPTAGAAAMSTTRRPRPAPRAARTVRTRRRPEARRAARPPRPPPRPAPRPRRRRRRPAAATRERRAGRPRPGRMPEPGHQVLLAARGCGRAAGRGRAHDDRTQGDAGARRRRPDWSSCRLGRRRAPRRRCPAGPEVTCRRVGSRLRPTGWPWRRRVVSSKARWPSRCTASGRVAAWPGGQVVARGRGRRSRAAPRRSASASLAERRRGRRARSAYRGRAGPGPTAGRGGRPRPSCGHGCGQRRARRAVEDPGDRRAHPARHRRRRPGRARAATRSPAATPSVGGDLPVQPDARAVPCRPGRAPRPRRPGSTAPPAARRPPDCTTASVSAAGARRCPAPTPSGGRKPGSRSSAPQTVAVSDA